MDLYPKNQLEFERWFSTESECLAYFASIRWPQGYRCLKCNGERYRAKSRGRFYCKDCNHEGSILAGTIFHRTHLEMLLWFRAAWWVTNQKHGVNALGLQRALGIGSYRSAWMMLHKLRIAMRRDEREPLDGKVEVDEVFIGSVASGKSGAHSKAVKKAVVIAAEIDGKGTGRIRMQKIPDLTRKTLHGFIERNVASESMVVTDGWLSYWGIENQGYIHRPTRKAHHHEPDPNNPDDLLPRVHRVASLLKRWLAGTYQGSVDAKYLDSYLEEFVFRFNRRTSRSRGLLFFRLLQNCVLKQAPTYEELTTASPH